jgi:hypothetical protein
MDGKARISAAIMTHPLRSEQATRLAAQHPALNFSIVCDPEPGQPRGTLRTSRLAWNQVAADATHHLVVQDDTILHPNFELELEAAVRLMPDRAIAFFTEWGSQTSYAVRLGALVGAGWVEVIDWYVPSHTLVLPAAAAREFDGYAGSDRPRPDMEDDELLFEYLRALGMRMMVSVPNWAEHAEGPSIAGNESHGLRKAAIFLPDLGLTRSPEILSPPPFIPTYSWLGGFSYVLSRPSDPGDLWSRAHLEELWREHGLDGSRLDGLLSAAGVAWPGEVCGTEADARRANSMALCAIAMGVAAASCRDVDIHEMLRSPIGQGAIATMIPGGLRRYFQPATLSAVSESMSAALARCVALGYLSAR